MATCDGCGTATFGRLCAVCTGERAAAPKKTGLPLTKLVLLDRKPGLKLTRREKYVVGRTLSYLIGEIDRDHRVARHEGRTAQAEYLKQRFLTLRAALNWVKDQCGPDAEGPEI